MKKIYSVLVENRSGVLFKVAGLFSRRAFNINSLVVGETDDPAVSCMTIVSKGDAHVLEQIEKQLNKKLDVIKVKTFDEQECITRELMLIKVRYNRNNRKDIMEISSIMKAEIVDMSKNQMLIQLCDTPERVQLFINMLQTISIAEVARTGTVALPRCNEIETQ
ncbi:MAG: acetolactate synthase small subunit [Lachnospiraceae bacterium]|nr:acetolactate synthase small subunit [Lachnospiraceae bacterium]